MKMRNTRVRSRLRLRLRKSPQKNFLTLTSTLISVFICLIFHCSLSHAEGLSDIKINALQAPIKERWGRDPFIRYEDKISKEKPSKEELPLDLKVDGIISDGKKALAIINGGFYRKHEMVNNFLIVGIGKDKVLLEKNGKMFELGIKKFAIEGTQKGESK